MVTLECFEKIIKKDWIHPLTSTKLKEKDVIFMQRVSVLYENSININFYYFREELVMLKQILTWKANMKDLLFKLEQHYRI